MAATPIHAAGKRAEFAMASAFLSRVAEPSTTYEPRLPSRGTLYQLVLEHFEMFRAQAVSLRSGEGLPQFVEQEFRDFLQCGWLAGGLPRIKSLLTIGRIRRVSKLAECPLSDLGAPPDSADWPREAPSMAPADAPPDGNAGHCRGEQRRAGRTPSGGGS